MYCRPVSYTHLDVYKRQGFIRIFDGKNPLEITAVHPESYEVAEKLLDKIGYKKEDLIDKDRLKEIRTKLAEINVKNVAKELEVGEMTLQDIVQELSKPGRDPREEMPKPILRADVLKFEDLKEGMVLTGTVRNVTDFGAFVDIGVKHDGLVPVSYTHLGMKKFNGIILFTSHDHQLTQTVANRIIDLKQDKLIDRETTYDEYLEEIK